MHDACSNSNPAALVLTWRAQFQLSLVITILFDSISCENSSYHTICISGSFPPCTPHIHVCVPAHFDLPHLFALCLKKTTPTSGSQQRGLYFATISRALFQLRPLLVMVGLESCYSLKRAGMEVKVAHIKRFAAYSPPPSLTHFILLASLTFFSL